MVQVPQRHYFRIGEAARLVGVKPYVLRYWETEFKQIRPEREGSRQRLYRRKDVLTFLEIKRLLREERYTIVGAKKRLAEAQERLDALRGVRDSLVELKRQLGG